MSTDLLAAVPSRQGHFQLESGYHTNVWLTLDGLFIEPQLIMPAVDALAERVERHGMTAVCGPFVGGAFLAQLLATKLGVRFFYAQPVTSGKTSGLFSARYELPLELQRRIVGERLAVVDEVISAGSSVRATIAAATAAGADVVVVAGFVVLGDAALREFARMNMPVESLERRPFLLWTPAECPLCASHVFLEQP